MCVVSRVSIDVRAGYHYVNLNVIEQKYITEECITENTLLEVNEKLRSKNDVCMGKQSAPTDTLFLF